MQFLFQIYDMKTIFRARPFRIPILQYVDIRVAQKIENYVIAGNDGSGNYNMILLLLFLISSTIRPRNAQNQNQKQMGH